MMPTSAYARERVTMMLSYGIGTELDESIW